MPLIFCLSGASALAGAAKSFYTPFDLDHCRQIDPGDEYEYEGAWSCTGYKDLDIVISGADARSFAAFGRNGMQHCAFRKTFTPFNTALSPVEWRIRDGKAFAAIERWSVVADENGNSVTWLVVNALRPGNSCHVHYVAGSYPDANAQARRAADDLAQDFDCASDVPTVDSKVGPPPIVLLSCDELARE